MLVLITDRRDFGRTLASHLRRKGVFLIQCPTEVALFTCERYDTGGVIMDAIEDPRAAATVCAALREAYPPMPIAVIPPPKQRYRFEGATRFLEPMEEQPMAEVCLDFYCQDCGWMLSDFNVYHLHVGVNPKRTHYMGRSFHVSPTEHRILRFLFYRPSQITSVDELMTVCFPDGTQKKENIAVHVRNINRRAMRFYAEPLIINVYGKGYRLRDGLRERQRWLPLLPEQK